MRARYALHRRALSNPVSRRRFRAQKPRLDDLQRRVLSDLLERGIATSSFQELVGDADLWDSLKTDIEAFAEEAADTRRNVERPETKGDYYISRWAAKHAPGSPKERPMSIDDPWVSLGLCDRVLDVVNAYRGLYTQLIAVDNVYTVPFPASERRVGAQNWHRDPEDLHVVKVFLYFSDVDGEAGPFEYIQGSAEGGPYGDLWPWRVKPSTYPPADELERVVSPADRVSVEGPAGTMIFCDTSGWHRGGFANSKPRTLSNQAYVSPACVAAGRTRPRFVVNRSASGRQLTDAAQFAIEAATTAAGVASTPRP